MSNIDFREVRVIYPSFLHVCSGVREFWYVLEKLTPKRLDVKSTAQIRPQCSGKLCLECLEESIVCFQRFCPKLSLKMNFVQTNYKPTTTIHFKLNFSRTATSNYNFKLNLKPNFSRTTTSNYNFKPNFSRTTTSNYNFQLIFNLNFLSTSNWKLLQTKLFEHFELKVTSNYTF